MITPIEAFADSVMEFEGWFGPSQLHPLGSLSWRNRNPGNLRSANTMTGVDAQGYAIFSGLCAGYTALLEDLKAKITGHTSTGLGPGSTIQEFFQKYAPSTDHNYPDVYARYVANFLALALKRPISSATKLGDLGVN